MSHTPDPVRISTEEAKEYLLGHHGLKKTVRSSGAKGVRAALRSRGCIQLDPLDPMGTNADLVAMARVDGLKRGEVFTHLLPGHAFEHFAKERCLLPASAFPYYRDQAAETPWWHLRERLKRLPEGLIEAVLEEIRARGPISLKDLSDRGAVIPMDWSGWKGTSRAAAMAVEVLWTRCQVVVCGRIKNTKLFDIPARALPKLATAPAGEFGPWALEERAKSAGLLARAGGPQWSMLSKVRTSVLPDELVQQGRLEEVEVEGSSRKFLAPAGFREKGFPKGDGRMRILGPLDPLIWDRKLVKQVFGFDYVWEVYKPVEKRVWGWYVCPLLHKGEFVGRLEGRVTSEALEIFNVWKEADKKLDDDALDAALQRHAVACGVEKFTRPSAR